MKITNLAVEPLGVLDAWPRQGLEMDPELFLPDACPSKVPPSGTRSTVARIMGAVELRGVVRGWRTTIAELLEERPQDLVRRRFTATRPNEFLVVNFVFVATWNSMCSSRRRRPATPTRRWCTTASGARHIGRFPTPSACWHLWTTSRRRSMRNRVTSHTWLRSELWDSTNGISKDPWAVLG